KVVKHLRNNNQFFPRRRGGQLNWGPLDAAHLHSVLTNPAYVGNYVFGRTRAARRTGRSPARIERRPASERITTPDHHEAYVSRRDWEQVQAMLGANRPAMRSMAGKGHALLQGLVRCGICGKRMVAKYWGREGQARTGSYRCKPRDA